MRLLCLDIPLPGASPENYQPLLLEETRHGWQLYKSSFARDIYFRQESPGVAIIAESDSIDTARKSLATTDSTCAVEIRRPAARAFAKFGTARRLPLM
jgi:hypothetical protein